MNKGQGPGDDGRGTVTDVRDQAPRFRRLAPGRRPTVIRYEQAVYGSFAFRDDGYAMLAQSPGCRPGWLADLRAACQGLGERPAGVADAPGMFALRLPSGPWAVVGVSPQGSDDRGRPGALAFHALFVSPRDYRRAGADPFALAVRLRSDWSAETRALAPGALNVAPAPDVAPAADPRAAAVAAAITRGRRVAVEAPAPIDGLARDVWRALPARVRGRSSVATWAFGNGNRFDLLAVPRRAGVALDASYVDAATLGAVPEPAPPRAFPVSPRALVATGAVVLLGAAAVGLALRGDVDDGDPFAIVPAPPAAVAPAVPRPPVRTAADVDPAERRRVAEALGVLAERFGAVLGGSGDTDPDPSARMERLARGLRYRGPYLSGADRRRLAADPGHDAALALRWDALVRRFADDRPLPDDFRRRDLRDQVEALAWSFRSEGSPGDAPDGPRRSPSEVVLSLGEALSVGLPLPPSPLAGRYPALASYRAFLSRLPRH